MVKEVAKEVTVETKPKKRKPPVRKKATGKTKKQRIIELAKQLEEENSAENTVEEKSPPAKKARLQKSPRIN